MPQEELTVKFFQRGAGVERINNAADFETIIAAWMGDRSVYDRLRNNFLKLRYEETPTVLITELVDLAQQVAGTSIKPRPFSPRAYGAQ
jgi:processive 1,2-diacylglycerol beta-glucosyltransferase